jgi:hypothetical protein
MEGFPSFDKVGAVRGVRRRRLQQSRDEPVPVIGEVLLDNAVGGELNVSPAAAVIVVLLLDVFDLLV